MFLKPKVTIHRIVRASGCGLPEVVIQKEANRVQEKYALTGTAKAVVLIGDDGCPGPLVFSVYDLKQVHFISRTAINIKQITNDQEIFGYNVDKCVPMKFLQKHMQEMYNYCMNNIDIKDQYTSQYKIDY